MTTMTKDEAWAIWKLANVGAQPDISADDWTLMEKAEIAILRSTPESGSDVARMLDVILNDLEAGPRADGADIKGLRRIRSWALRLSGSSEGKLAA